MAFFAVFLITIDTAYIIIVSIIIYLVKKLHDNAHNSCDNVHTL
jgi:hypothetical protein